MEVGGGGVSFSSGTMESLIRKLPSFPADINSKGLGTEIKGLKDELCITQHNMLKFKQMREPTVQAKQWMKQVREIVYDIEDWVDKHLHRAVDREAEKHVGVVKGLVQRVKKLQGAKDEPPSNQIQEFKALIKAANDRFERYDLEPASSISLDQFVVATAADTGDTRARALHADETGLVGINGPVNDLLKKLDAHKVVFLVGSGGLGKTTLATQVWRRPRMQQQFKLRAFVHAGQNPSVKAILISILDQVKLNEEGLEGYGSWKEQKLIDKLKEFLGRKRYLIVIDDLWSLTAWQVIKCALPEESKDSRVIITTSNEEVASSSSNDPNRVYKMGTLGNDHEKALLVGRVFGPVKGCPVGLAKCVDGILKICDGVPLAIITMAGLLASKEATESQWISVYKSIIRDQRDVDGVKKILYLSYTELPKLLKTCFLYLSVFPEGYVMRKDRVIRRWIAEGFIGKCREESLQEQGERCFNELINRGLIQPLPVQDNGEREYVVHDLVHELIISVSTEENFVTMSPHLINGLAHDMVRRLSLQYKAEKVSPTLLTSGILSQVRSLTILGPFIGRNEGQDGLGRFCFLRVLDLEDANTLERHQLQSIDKRLFQLKYLGLGGNQMTSLPKHIGAIQTLETLDIRRTGVRKLAVDDGGFAKLVHLLVKDVELLYGVKKMKELQELSMVDVSNSNTLLPLQELGEAEKLRILGFKWGLKKGDTGSAEAACENSLVDALNKLGDLNLQSLCIDVGEGSSLDFLVDSWRPSLKLREFKLACSHYCFPQLPKKMGKVIIPNLTYLEIGITTVSEGDLNILRGLPSLILLKLRCKESCGLVISSQGFPSLEVFWFERSNGSLTELTFKEEAMPKLWKLRLRCNVKGATSLAAAPGLGLKNLASLKQVHVKLDYEVEVTDDVEAAEDAIRAAVDAIRAAEDAIRANVPDTCSLEITA